MGQSNTSVTIVSRYNERKKAAAPPIATAPGLPMEYERPRELRFG
ncbi:hypothetical protein THTE_2295 [Thermogutta terrifontis]|uniref:Uncharacterized protein n=1 Tax=Thermogutta terrifontis TaxID=1331910 RepID=A0A286RG17_9BACT|nr:hypothetical protein [Thermogutta terrifontis]ASV74897.1 hypothetical protein THTE_2295 [Thermogutta terrifontis]